MADFDIEVFSPAARDDVMVLRLSGNLDSYSLSLLEQKLQEILEKQKKCHLIVNCQKLRFLSSPGMGLFLGTLGEIEKRGGSLVFAQVNQPEVYDAMDLLGFFDIFPVYEEELEAIEKTPKR